MRVAERRTRSWKELQDVSTEPMPDLLGTKPTLSELSELSGAFRDEITPVGKPRPARAGRKSATKDK